MQTVHDTPRECVAFVPTSGPVSFDLLAVWTWPAPSYIKAFLNGLSAYADLIRRDSGGRGLQREPAFDKPKQRIKWWTNGFSRLHDAGLVSAYHEYNRVAFGNEPLATHHFLRRPERSFSHRLLLCSAALDGEEIGASGCRGTRVEFTQ
jgi:hypothetical protein